MPKSKPLDNLVEFLTSDVDEEIIMITEYKVKPLHYIFGVVDLTQTTKAYKAMAKKHQVPQFACVLTLSKGDVWTWFCDDDLDTCKRIYRETMDKFKDGEEIMIIDTFGYMPTIKVWNTGLRIEGPVFKAKYKVKRK